MTLPTGGKDLYIQQDKYGAQFAADVSASVAKLAAATQRPITEAALNEPSGAPAWKTIPSWHIYGDGDKNIPAAAMAFMAERAKSKETVVIKVHRMYRCCLVRMLWPASSNARRPRSKP